MLDILYKYLILNSRVSIPGIGRFQIRRQPASLDFVNKTFIPPSGKITFTEGSTIDDKKFYSFLANEQQVEDEVAARHFDEFTASVKERLQAQGSMELAGLGLLSKDVTGKLSFQPLGPITSIYPNVAAERTIREVSAEMRVTTAKKKKVKQTVVESGGAETSSNKKDYWWIFAIVLAVIAIAAIFYYYKQNGSLR